MSMDTARAATGTLADKNDHRRIATSFLIWTLGLFLFGAIGASFLKLKVLAGVEQSVPELNQVQTYHGIVMVFMVIVPLLPSVLGYLLLPGKLGAREMALPGMSRISFWSYALGTLTVLASLLIKPVSTGWTMTTPYAFIDGGAFGLMALGLALTAFSWVLTGVNIIATVHLRRKEGMGFFDMPILCWSLYLTAFVQVLVGLIFGIAVLFLGMIALNGKGMVDGVSDPINWQSYFWFATTAVAYFAMIPAVGVITEIISSLARKAVVGYRLMVGALIALSGVALVSWGVHLIGRGQPEALSFTFSVLSLIAVIPAALIVYGWLATLHRGAVAWNTVTVFTLAFLICGGIGAFLGLFLSNLSLAAWLDSTVFATAQMHYLLMGGVMTALIAGLFHWWPTISGRAFSDRWGMFSGWVYLIGMNLAFFPQILMGALGQPAGIQRFPLDTFALHKASSLGIVLLGVALSLMVFTLLRSLGGAKIQTEG